MTYDPNPENFALNFPLVEFEHSDTAIARGIDNRAPEYLHRNLKVLSHRLQAVRAIVGRAVIISSGYRCPELNKEVGGDAVSQHLLGLAADLQVKGMSAQELYELIRDSGIPYDKLIIEKSGSTEWVHMSVQPGERGELMSYVDGKYTKL